MNSTVIEAVVREGRKPGQFITSWRNENVIDQHGRTYAHMVFVNGCNGIRDGQTVRLALERINKADCKGKAMFVGKPAPEKLVRNWVVNPDGSASYVEYALNYLLELRIVRIIETYPKGRLLTNFGAGSGSMVIDKFGHKVNPSNYGYWPIVKPDELAIKGEDGIITIAQRPDNITQFQIQAALYHEASLGEKMKEVLELVPGQQERHAVLVQLIQKKFNRCPNCGKKLSLSEFKYVDMLRGIGLHLKCFCDPNNFKAVTHIFGEYMIIVSSSYNYVLSKRQLYLNALVLPPSRVKKRLLERSDFQYESSRWFRCSCGATEKISKADFQKYTAENEVVIICESCGAIGVVKKP